MYYNVLSSTNIPDNLDDINKAIDIFFEPWEHYGKDYREKVFYDISNDKFLLTSNDFLGTIEFDGVERDTAKNTLHVKFTYYVNTQKGAHDKYPYYSSPTLFMSSKVVNKVINTKGSLQNKFGITDLYFTMFSSICEVLCNMGMKSFDLDDKHLFDCIDQYINLCLDSLNLNVPKSNPIYETEFFDLLSKYAKPVSSECCRPCDYDYKDLVLYSDSSNLVSSDELYLEIKHDKHCDIYIRRFDTNTNNDFRFCLNDILLKPILCLKTLCVLYIICYLFFYLRKRYIDILEQN